MNMPMVMRYVIWSDTHGIFLGIGGGEAWSMKNHMGIRSAPTFLIQEAEGMVLRFQTRGEQLERIQCRPVQVYPDLDNYYASPVACIKSCLPGW